MGSKITKSIFFSTFSNQKTSDFVSYMNDDFYDDSFEAFNSFLGQKLTILEFSPKIYFVLTSVTSEILTKGVSFHMRYCLLSWDKNGSIHRPLSLSRPF